ncbi:MAG TPA: hypothetical protein PLP29_12470 [Candidatus Ozemobacteraceae bacterium]|nr:hypothetical protein [Candidatus Ozemobacteraceae bacterium]
MSIGGISGSRYESLRTQFESFRSGNSKIQKADLEELQTALSSGEASKGGSTGSIGELIDAFSEIDTNGDGISVDELDTAARSGIVSAPRKPGQGPDKMKGPPPGPPPEGGMGGPGGAKGMSGTDGQDTQTGTAQSDLLGYSLYEEFLRKIQEQAEPVTSSAADTSESSANALSSLTESDSEQVGSSEASAVKESSSSLTDQEAQSLARMLSQQIMQANGRYASAQQTTISSLLGGGLTV